MSNSTIRNIIKEFNPNGIKKNFEDCRRSFKLLQSSQAKTWINEYVERTNEVFRSKDSINEIENKLGIKIQNTKLLNILKKSSDYRLKKE